MSEMEMGSCMCKVISNTQVHNKKMLENFIIEEKSSLHPAIADLVKANALGIGYRATVDILLKTWC